MISIIFITIIIFLLGYTYLEKIRRDRIELQLLRDIKCVTIKYNTLKDENIYLNEVLYKLERKLRENDRQ